MDPLKNILFVIAGGAAGCAIRYLVSLMVPYSAGQFPWATFLVNILGCGLAGVFLGYSDAQKLNSSMMLLLMTGFCGGFTTFSAFAAEGIHLLNEGKAILSITYAAISVIAGMVALFTAYKIVQS